MKKNNFKILKLIGLCFFVAVSFNTIIYSQNKEVPQKKYTKQIKNLLKNKKVKSAFKYIEDQDDETIKDMVALTEILAPPFKESTRAQYFKQLLEKAGADKIWIDKEGNVLALRKGTQGDKLFGFDAHLDVVFPPGTNVKVRNVNDTLKAPGIGDDTRGLSMIISVLKAMNKAKIKTKNDILFVGTVGEEGLGDLRGMKYIFNKSGLKIDGWISIDGGNLGRINNAALGSKRYKVLIQGKGGHSWGDFGLANPHHALGKVIDYFTKAASEYTAQKGPKTSFNVGRIGGGTSVNSIPFESWAEIDMRSKSPKRLLEIEAILKASVKKAINDYNATDVKHKVTYKMIKIGDRPSGELSTELPLIQKAMAAVIAFGGTPKFTRGSTNASIPISKNIPAICIGRGGKAGGAHSLHEWFLNDKTGVDSIKLAFITLLAQAELTK